MSKQVYGIGGLRCWSAIEIDRRDFAVKILASYIEGDLRGLNRDWQMVRFEMPVLIPTDNLPAEYGDDDIFEVDGGLALRPETTPSSYGAFQNFVAPHIRPPVCIWQAGKSFRQERNDGARASKLRFNEFYQCEFQCLYSPDSKADYRKTVVEAALRAVATLLPGQIYTTPSDRVPSYAESTTDIMCGGMELASISVRKDAPGGLANVEAAFGLDRIVEFMGGWRPKQEVANAE